MSRNFELMQQAGPGNEIGRVSQPMRPVSTGEPNGNGHRNGTHLDIDRIAGEELLKLVQRVFLTQAPNRPRAVVFAGVDPGDGSTQLCADTARTLARNATGFVCLVDANSHSNSLPRILGANNRHGLADALRQGGALGDFTQQLSPKNLRFLSFGSLGVDSGSLFSSDGVKTRLAELLDEFEFVLINAPSVILDGTATLLGQLVDGVIVVVEANSTHREVARKAKERLESANVRLLGAVFNNRTFPIPAAVYSRL